MFYQRNQPTKFNPFANKPVQKPGIIQRITTKIKQMFEQRINSQAAISINYSQQIINVPMDHIEAEIVERDHVVTQENFIQGMHRKTKFQRFEDFLNEAENDVIQNSTSLVQKKQLKKQHKPSYLEKRRKFNVPQKKLEFQIKQRRIEKNLGDLDKLKESVIQQESESVDSLKNNSIMQVLPDEIVENMNREKKITLDKESQTLSLGIQIQQLQEAQQEQLEENKIEENIQQQPRLLKKIQSSLFAQQHQQLISQTQQDESNQSSEQISQQNSNVLANLQATNTSQQVDNDSQKPADIVQEKSPLFGNSHQFTSLFSNKPIETQLQKADDNQKEKEEPLIQFKNEKPSELKPAAPAFNLFNPNPDNKPISQFSNLFQQSEIPKPEDKKENKQDNKVISPFSGLFQQNEIKKAEDKLESKKPELSVFFQILPKNEEKQKESPKKSNFAHIIQDQIEKQAQPETKKEEIIKPPLFSFLTQPNQQNQQSIFGNLINVNQKNPITQPDVEQQKQLNDQSDAQPQQAEKQGNDIQIPAQQNQSIDKSEPEASKQQDPPSENRLFGNLLQKSQDNIQLSSGLNSGVSQIKNNDNLISPSPSASAPQEQQKLSKIEIFDPLGANKSNEQQKGLTESILIKKDLPQQKGGLFDNILLNNQQSQQQPQQPQQQQQQQPQQPQQQFNTPNKDQQNNPFLNSSSKLDNMQLDTFFSQQSKNSIPKFTINEPKKQLNPEVSDLFKPKETNSLFQMPNLSQQQQQPLQQQQQQQQQQIPSFVQQNSSSLFGQSLTNNKGMDIIDLECEQQQPQASNSFFNNNNTNNNSLFSFQQFPQQQQQQFSYGQQQQPSVGYQNNTFMQSGFGINQNQQPSQLLNQTPSWQQQNNNTFQQQQFPTMQSQQFATQLFQSTNAPQQIQPDLFNDGGNKNQNSSSLNNSFTSNKNKKRQRI